MEIRITASVGVSSYPHDSTSKAELLHLADEAMYLVKNTSRDSVAAANVGMLPASATPDVGALQPVVDYLRDEDGRFPFTVNVTGPAAKPKVQVDFDALKKRAEEKGKDELEDKVQDTVKDLLGKFKGKK